MYISQNTTENIYKYKNEIIHFTPLECFTSGQTTQKPNKWNKTMGKKITKDVNYHGLSKKKMKLIKIK